MSIKLFIVMRTHMLTNWYHLPYIYMILAVNFRLVRFAARQETALIGGMHGGHNLLGR